MDESTQTAARTTGAQNLSERLEPTSRAISAAHDRHLRNSLAGVVWERRGFLGRLTRSPR